MRKMTQDALPFSKGIREGLPASNHAMARGTRRSLAARRVVNYYLQLYASQPEREPVGHKSQFEWKAGYEQRPHLAGRWRSGSRAGSDPGVHATRPGENSRHYPGAWADPQPDFYE